jgi:hypothetical protein
MTPVGGIAVGKATSLFAITLALAVTSVGQAATLIKTDFTQNADGWKLNGNAQLEKIDGDSRAQVLSLTQNEGGQAGTAWNEAPFKVPSFSYIADVRIRFNPPSADDCPADGFAMVFAPAEADTIGAGGGSIGLFGGPETFTAFDLNTWQGQGLGENGCSDGKQETFAIDVINPGVEDPSRTPGENGTPEKGGAKIGQINPPAGMKIVNGGFYRYQWNVSDSGLHTVYVTGLDDANKQFQKVKVLEVKFPNSNAINFQGRFGMTAATGGAVQFTEIAAARVESPMVDPQ